ncbi:MAG: hypothetical protein K2W96_06445 [Gemmataceae bacterium]|nr:hypothetical protein [Gemmataceae bacterium]
MNDRPDARELIDAVRGFLEKELLPTVADARLRFTGLVAAQALAVAARELETETSHLAEEAQELALLLGVPVPAPTREAVRALTETLCRRIEDGLDTPALLGVLRRITERKLAVTGR